MKTVKILTTHIVLYLLTYLVLDFVEDNVTASGAVALAIISLSLPMSFVINLWAVGGFSQPRRKHLVGAAVIACVISPLSAVLWLTIYINIVGYSG